MRYIDADELLDRVQWANTNPLIDHGETAVKLIKAMPTIETEPVKHGRWIDRNEGKWNRAILPMCSECGETFYEMQVNIKNLNTEYSYNYCPNCGAKMDGGEND